MFLMVSGHIDRFIQQYMENVKDTTFSIENLPEWTPILNFSFIPVRCGISSFFMLSNRSKAIVAISDACRLPLGFGTPLSNRYKYI